MEVKTTPHSVHFNQMGWPKPSNDLAWTLRYGTPNKNQLLLCAWILEAYSSLVLEKTQRERNLICKTIKETKNDE